jgi:N-acetylmuramoyl-L-alanine amidase
MTKICISSGHGLKVRGASGVLDEVDEARKVVETVADFLREAGVEVATFHDDVSTSQNENLNRIVNWHNAQSRDLDVSVHFNAYQTTSKPMGCEVLYVSQSELAAEVSAAIANAGSFIDRGDKYRSDLFFLNSTNEPAILLETCFVDSSADAELYGQHYESICRAIAESISGEQVPIEPAEPEEPDQPEPPEPGSGENRIDIVSRTQGQVAFVINGQLVSGRERCPNAVYIRAKVTGDIVISINGQELHNKPEGPDELPPQPLPGPTIPENQKNITATVFGGEADDEYSAYGPYDSQGRGPYLNDTDYYVSLPVTIDDASMRERGVRVFNPDNELSAVGPIMDKGPWVVNDDDYVFGDQRPIAETCYKNKQPLPSGSGSNAGKVPSNDAGIDLSPALANAIGIEGKGKVHWQLVTDEAETS